MLINLGMTCNNNGAGDTSTALTQSNLDKLNSQNASRGQPPKSPTYPSRVSTPPSMDPSRNNNALGKSSSDKQGTPQGTVLDKANRVETFQVSAKRQTVLASIRRVNHC